MHAFLVSVVAVALAEIGDKTQLLSFVLAARLRSPWAIVLGILAATLANHAVAATVGVWIAGLLGPVAMRWIIGGAFLAFGVWALVPDTLESEPRLHAAGAFVTTLVAFFLVEMGDKTQLATIALAARYQTLVAVVVGTTLGMLLANVPAVLLGEALAERLPLRALRWGAAALFIALGAATLAGLGA